VQERGVSGLVESILDASPPESGRYHAAVAAIEAPLIAAALARTNGKSAPGCGAAGDEPEHAAGADAVPGDEGEVAAARPGGSR
jgi:hypothetical protein